MTLFNGAIYRRNTEKFALVFVESDKWMMLSITGHIMKELNCPMLQHDVSGKYAFTRQELKDQFGMDEWEQVSGRLKVEQP